MERRIQRRPCCTCADARSSPCPLHSVPSSERSAELNDSASLSYFADRCARPAAVVPSVSRAGFRNDPAAAAISAETRVLIGGSQRRLLCHRRIVRRAGLALPHWSRSDVPSLLCSWTATAAALPASTRDR